MEIKYAYLTSVASDTMNELVIKKQCGWFDGGCMTLASAVNILFQQTTFYHISRNNTVVDHVVIFFPELNRYFDADGFQSQKELFDKMRAIEKVNVEVLEKMSDSHFNQIEIFTDIVKIFTQRYTDHLC